MPDKNKNSFVLGFAAAVCVVCSLFVSGAATVLKERQQENIRVDKQKNILAALKLVDPATATPSEVSAAFESGVEAYMISRDGERLDQPVPASFDCTDLFKDGSTLALPVYAAKDGGFAIPICGKGLWSTLYGYFALEADGTTVKGITFYKHGETPGLGGEVEKPWFQENFIGKRVVDARGELVSVSVVKGKVAEVVPAAEAYHNVDGISGATMTSRGVTEFLRRVLDTYEPYFKKIRKEA